MNFILIPFRGELCRSSRIENRRGLNQAKAKPIEPLRARRASMTRCPCASVKVPDDMADQGVRQGSRVSTVVANRVTVYTGLRIHTHNDRKTLLLLAAFQVCNYWKADGVA